MLNSLLFPEDPADANILGMARYMVVNDPRHALQTEFLQRTMPYFFRPVADTEYVKQQPSNPFFDARAICLYIRFFYRLYPRIRTEWAPLSTRNAKMWRSCRSLFVSRKVSAAILPACSDCIARNLTRPLHTHTTRTHTSHSRQV